MPAHLDCSELFFVLWTQSHSPSSGTLLMWFPLLEMISLFPAYLWNPIHVCVHVTTIFLMLMNSVSQKCRQNTAGTTYLSSTLSGASAGKTWTTQVIQWLEAVNVQRRLHSLQIAPLQISLTSGTWAGLPGNFCSTELLTEAPIIGPLHVALASHSLVALRFRKWSVSAKSPTHSWKPPLRGMCPIWSLSPFSPLSRCVFCLLKHR